MNPLRDKAAEQLSEFRKANQNPSYLTTSSGQPIGNKKDALTVGPRGPLLVNDTVYLDEIQHWVRERIPERVVHSKGAGAFGYFEVTHDISKYCKAGLFSEIGKRTPIAMRFSTVAGESGSADTVRDPRGFAIKFYTEEGNWDLTGNNTPIFFVRDVHNFPSFIHSQKRNPVTHLKDPDMFWDFMGLRPECTHQLTFHYSDRGIPDGYRHMNGYGSHTYKMVNAKGEAVYVKFHEKTNQGIKNIPANVAEQLAGSDPDYSTRDLYNAIANNDFPSWNFYIQVMTFEQAEKFRWNPFDLTKIWPHSEHPLIPIGKLVLNRNPSCYFSEVEQLAFSPSHFVPGIEASPDKMLQGRLLAYPDTHFYRLGTNYLQIPVNCPYRARVATYQRDGPQTITNQPGAPNYFPNSFNGPQDGNPKYLEHKYKLSGDVARYNTEDDDNFTQPGNFWRNVLKPDERARLVENMAAYLVKTLDFIQERIIQNATKCDADYGNALKAAVKKQKQAHGIA